MKAKKIKVNLFDLSSIDDAIKQLDEYQNSLQRKIETYISEMARLGEDVALRHIHQSQVGNTITVSSTTSPTRTGCKAVIMAVGTTYEHNGYAPFNTLLAVEFGAGIKYNGTPNPIADEFGMGIGTFPGQIHAFDPDGWYYWDESSNSWKHSYGIKATMPMYNASLELIQRYKEKAMEVFAVG